MLLIGLAVTVVGFLIAVLSLGITGSVSGRMILVLAGLAISLSGIIRLVNKAYLRDAIWKK